ncbi:MAG: type II toxin-antitoxin system Phd/YefM family antitoxin [Planctomycetota bacterium]|nr:type II toxin-antitoxin system Phd/YefM family antitoxin [Planctomycetota bacterium]
MTSLTVAQARGNLGRLIRDATATHEPIRLAGRQASAVLVSEEDWRAIQETLYLLSIPGMRRSIRKGLATPVSKCAKKVTW